MPHQLFISYAHEDEIFKDQLCKHLRPLERNGVINVWQDGVIIPGQNWDEEISSQLAKSQVVLFLISADFMSSDYIERVELAEAIAKHQEGTQTLIPIIIRACDFSSLEKLALFQALPKQAKPVKSWTDRDEAWSDVVKGLKRVLADLSKPMPKSIDVSITFDKVAVMTEYYCYCCNRGKQYDKIMEFYDHCCNENFPHLHFFIPSTYEDKPDSFITRFLQDKNGINDKYLSKNRQDGIDKLLHININPSVCQKEINAEIQKQLADAKRENTEEGHLEAFFFRLSLKDWEHDKCKILFDYLINDLQSGFHEHKILTFFWLDTLGMDSIQPQNMLQRFFNKKRESPLSYITTEAAAHKNMIVLPDMASVKKEEVHNWFYDYCSDTVCFKSIIDKELFKDGQMLRMGNIESFLLKLIKQ